MTASATTLVLFDIDGTLLHLHGAGRQAFALALERVYGVRDGLAHIRFAGATDRLILRRILEERDHAGTPEQEAAFFEDLPRALALTLRGAERTLYPGVRALLDALARQDGCLLGLVTGNIEACAYLKLRQFDLDAYFAFGGFGDDHAERVEIARIALARAQARLSGQAVFSRVVLVGDALSDMEAARAVGATAIGVTTGVHRHAELLAAGADHVLADLADRDRVLAIIGAP